MAKSIEVHRDNQGKFLSVNMVRPSNMHAHLRFGPLMQAVAVDIMRWPKHLLAMPNSQMEDGRPIDTIEKMIRYRSELLKIRDDHGFSTELVMTIYFTSLLTPQVVEELAALPFPVAVKYYPPEQGATTGSGFGMPLRDADETLRAMSEYGIRFLGHFESVTDKHGRTLPMEFREEYFMNNVFSWLRETYPDLLISIEHGSTISAVEHVKADTSGKTVIGYTPHHLLLSFEELVQYTWRNHGRCMPIPKNRDHVAACQEFAMSGDFRAILGDDTAAHPSKNKEGMPFDEAACGCWLPHSLALYVLAFELRNALDMRFVNFACINGPMWWGLELPDPDDRIELKAEHFKDIPEPIMIPGQHDVVVPLGFSQEGDQLKVGAILSEY